MFDVRLTVLALAATLSHATCGGDLPLLTVAEANALSFDDHRTGRVFRLTGRAYGLDGAHKFILGDDTGRTILCDIKEAPEPGTCVDVDVRARFNPILRRYLAAGTWRDTGRFELEAPVRTSFAEILSGKTDYHTVIARGRVADVSDDDIDPGCRFLTLTDGTDTILVTGEPERLPENLVEAEVETCGICLPHVGGWRKMQGRAIRISRAASGIRILKPAPADSFDAPALGDPQKLDERLLLQYGRRTARGRVLAAWQGSRILVDLGLEAGMLLQAVFAPGTRLPAPGDLVELAGRPGTDLFQLVFSHAFWRPAGGTFTPSVDLSRPTDVSARALIAENGGQRQIVANWHGRLVRLEGLVRSLPEDPRDGKVLLDCRDDRVPLDISAAPDAFVRIAPGSRVRVTGIALLQADLWRPDAQFPRVGGVALVIRSPEDVTVLARPPWWTPARFIAVLALAALALVGILIWNLALRRVAERRGRALFRAQMGKAASELRLDERTRLAGELHDSLAQNLTAIAYQVSSALREPRPAGASSAASSHLETAARMLASCRTDLRRCLWDLRSDALDERDFAKAIRMSVEPVLGEAALEVRVTLSRNRLSDSTAHALLSILRELASNAIRHGGASRILIQGASEPTRHALSVEDNGCGFEPAACPGPEAGHFGLEGVRERLRRLSGSLAFERLEAGGMRATIILPKRTPTLTPEK